MIDGVTDEDLKALIRATVLTILIFETQAAQHRDQWGVAVNKARKMLNKHAKKAVLDGKPVLGAVRDKFFLHFDRI